MTDQLLLNGSVALPHLGIIRAKGSHAASFLHNQLTQDFLLLAENDARLAGFCSAKGRVQASFIAWRQSPDEFLLVCAKDVLAATLKRLSMFVLRAQVTLSDASADYRIVGVVGPLAQSLGVPDQPWRVARSGAETFISLYQALQQPCALLVVPSTGAPPVGPSLSLDQWHWTQVASGIVTINLALTDLFVPQMLNYESVGGINFKKGCYPGQEVIARSQFRGAIKRRTFLGHCVTSAEVGSPLFTLTDPTQSCGTVLACAAHPNGGFDMLVCAHTHSLEHDGIHINSISGPLVTVLPLPYPLLDDI